VHDYGEHEGQPYIVMRYMGGGSVDDLLRSGPIPLERILDILEQIAPALDYAHSKDVLHRDLKPSNVLLDENGGAYLTDFGIARLTDTSRTKTGIILGTPSYMSPEQLAGNPVTGQSDLYSLGITLYHLLTGAPPFRADSIPKLMDKIVNERHVMLSTQRDDIPLCVDDFFDSALAKDPEDRFANGRAMALALRDCCSSFAD
jgi:serine/threonine-protein kinase